MGYSRCAVPSCCSRPGRGVLFKYLPKERSLRQSWLESVPSWVTRELNFNDENSSRRIAFCEVHFKPSDIEMGAYEKRKLSHHAIPSIFSHPTNSPRILFKDITNCIQVDSSCSQQTSVIESACGSPFVNGAKQSSPVFHTSTPCARKILPFPDEENEASDDHLSLDEKTGLMKKMNLIGEETPVDLINEETPVDLIDQSQVLCESTGIFIPLSPTTAQLNDTAMDSGFSQSIWEGIVDSLEDNLSNQAAQIAKLQEENDKKDSIIQEQQKQLELLRTEVGSFSKHCKAVTRSKQRMGQKLKSFGSRWLTESQIERLARKNRRGIKWSIVEIRLGLIFKMKCGTSAYNDFVKMFPLLPSVRSLQEAVQFIRFDAGLLYEMFDLLDFLSKKLPVYERDCELVLDEMQLEESLRYDHALKKMVGNATLDGHSGVAKKALVFIIAGISRRWKVPVAVEFTNEKSAVSKKSKENPTGLAYKKLIDEVVQRTENASLYVCCVTSDMGPDNLAFWKTCDVSTGRKGEVRNSFPNPVREGEHITILCDAVHLMKSFKSMLESNGTVELPADIVEQEGLPSSTVNYKHIEDLMHFESENELKVAFRLREENVHCKKQFKKMSVGTSKAVICHRTGVGLNMLAAEKEDETYKTTAWFVILMNTFFALATCRNRGLAISKTNPIAYHKAIALIKKVAYIFSEMKVGDGSFKPVQRGMMILCSGYLHLISYFLDKRGYRYLMLGRFTSDCIENIFSLIRLAQPIPNAVLFLQCLKVVGLAQFSQAVKGSSYDHEETSPLSDDDFLEEARKRAKERCSQRFYSSLEELMDNPIRKLNETDFSVLGDWERAVIYDMAGSVIAAIRKSNQTVCELCLSAVQWQDKERPHPASNVTQMKEFTLLRSDDGKRALQISVSDAVYRGLLNAELSFRLYREAAVSFQDTDVKTYFVDNLMYVWSGTGLPNCHAIGRKILVTFLDARLKQYGKVLKQKLKNDAIVRSSKSVAMRQAANRM